MPGGHMYISVCYFKLWWLSICSNTVIMNIRWQDVWHWCVCMSVMVSDWGVSMLRGANMGRENEMFNIHGQVRDVPWERDQNPAAPPWSLPQFPLIRSTSKRSSQSYSLISHSSLDLPMALTTIIYSAVEGEQTFLGFVVWISIEPIYLIYFTLVDSCLSL